VAQLRVSLACVVVATSLAACSGSDETVELTYPREASDETQIRAVVDLFNSAAADLDAAVLCRQVIAPSRRGESADACAESIGPAMEKAPKNWNAITNVSAIDVAADSATASGIQEGGSISLAFEREDGRWWMQVFD
jgi:hypothetical protein